MRTVDPPAAGVGRRFTSRSRGGGQDGGMARLVNRFRIATAAVVLLAGLCARGAEPTTAQLEFFEKRVRPIFVEHCYSCHSTTAKKVKGGLLLDSRAGVVKGGESGAVVVPGEP